MVRYMSDIHVMFHLTHLSVGFVDCSIGATAQPLCEDEVRQFWGSKAGGGGGGGGHADDRDIKFPSNQSGLELKINVPFTQNEWTDLHSSIGRSEVKASCRMETVDLVGK